MISHVTTPEHAAAAVGAAKYPPIGRRGACPTIRASGYDPENWEDYTKAANSDVIVNVLVEEREGYERIEDILDIPGIDIVFFGNFDLSISFGLPGETRWDHPVLARALERVVAAARKRGIVRPGLGRDKVYRRSKLRRPCGKVGRGPHRVRIRSIAPVPQLPADRPDA